MKRVRTASHPTDPIDLSYFPLPVFFFPRFSDASDEDSNIVYVIDELDRSLHTLLTRELLEMFLSACHPGSRSQLFVTTHDVLLIDQDIFQRDEMWGAERDASGASSLISFNEYKDVRYDKDIRKSYLQGRLGGIPHLLPTRKTARPPKNGVNEGDGKA